ncbi:MAG: histidine kinase [Eubacteriales bacterium]|nr:histidine kinase [Eubacteriales bacterium]
MTNLRRVSLKARIFISFFGILLLMLFTYIFMGSRFITRFTERQLADDYNSLLSEICDTMQDLLWNLTLTSGQILDNAEIQDTLILYQSASSPYVRQGQYSALMNNITMLTLSNTDISLLCLYDNEASEYIYSSYPISGNQRDSLPVLYQNSAFSFCGPCSSQSSYNGNPVLVLNRTETLSNGSSVTLSVETGFYSMLDPIRLAENKSAFLAVTNADSELIYTNFPGESSGEEFLSLLDSGKNSDYRSLSRSMPQGWQVYLILSNQIYARDYYHAISEALLVTIFIAVLVGLIAVYFWKSIYAPLQLFDRQLEMLLSDQEISREWHSSIPEYDHLLQKIFALQKQIQQMIQQIIAQEKTNARMQLEKLRAQINPHFLLNTLNTMHWMALINEQHEIDDITQALAHLLSYNLDKDNVSTSLAREIGALGEYVRLQKVRYDFNFAVSSPPSPGDLNYPCPKFMLQPLVENALSHGYRPGMEIRVNIQIDERIHIVVSDTGTGITPERLAVINRLRQASFTEETDAAMDAEGISRFGIGLSYVVSSLHSFFSGDCSFSAASEEGSGTSIFIEFPKVKGGGYHAEDIDCR